MYPNQTTMMSKCPLSSRRSCEIHDQQVDLQTHLEDLENRSRRHTIQIRGIPTNEEKSDLFELVTEPFNHILGNLANTDIRLDRVHRMGPPRSDASFPADILVCVQDFRTKEDILRKARLNQPLSFRGQTPTFYQDLAAITLLKCKSFKPVTSYLRQQDIKYSWGSPVPSDIP